MNWEINSGCPGHAAPVTRFPSVKQRSIGSGSNHVAPERTTLSFTAGYAVHFLPYYKTMNKKVNDDNIQEKEGAWPCLCHGRDNMQNKKHQDLMAIYAAEGHDKVE